MTESDATFWDDLLDYVEEGRVIPVAGPELLAVRDGERELPLQHWIAERLAQQLRLSLDGLPEGYALNHVVARFLENRGRRVDLYKRIHSLLKDAPLEPPQALLDLASVDRFNLFVSLTFDTLLERAIDRVRYGGNARTKTIAYAPSDVQDLPSEMKDLPGPVVYHLLGRLSVAPDYVVCEEDLLEFLHHLQDTASRPPLLFDELRTNSLLILGSDFSDWLARFFLRATKNERLSQERAEKEWLVDSRSGNDPGLVTFLGAFSRDTQVLGIANPGGFCAGLAQRWRERHPADTPPVVRPPDRAGAAPPGAIFLSYASQDKAAASRLAGALEAAGLDVWFDRNELQTADDWDRKIRRAIEGCALFMPLISRVTQERTRAYFWQEWNLADEYAGRMAPGEPFLVPVVVDDTPENGAEVPERFRRAQWTLLAGGQPTADFVTRIRDLYRAYHGRQVR
ncbi:MAG TPA: toll/interleukin-1 receptor domain-containing protein [Burkholderiales bacterium]